MNPAARRAALLLATALLAGCSPWRWLFEPRISMLVLGDTGRTPREGVAPPGQVAVGRALLREHDADPVDLVLFTGDNFYPDGLASANLELRVRANLIEPYCAFVRPAPRVGPELLGACAEPGTHAVDLLAVLGNHDHHLAESPQLERETLPLYVENWRVLGAPVERVSLARGVDLIAYDSTFLRSDAGEPYRAQLTQALRDAPGPWRILFAHHPLDDQERSHPLERAIAEAGVLVQLQLAGHIHDLRASMPGARLPALQAVSGGGGGSESRLRPLPQQLFVLPSTGFARVDLYPRGRDPRIAITWFAVARDAPGAPAQPIARWVVTLDGVVRDETAGLAHR